LSVFRSISCRAEAAGDPLLALVLAGVEVTSLSMAPTKVPAVRYTLGEHDLAACGAIADAARAAGDAAQARAAALALYRGAPELVG
jgi:phosphotransferase system enzyme I (PtsI)